MHQLIILLLVVALTGCASSRGFDRGNLRTQIADQYGTTEGDGNHAGEQKPHLRMPFKLALYFTPPKSDRRHERCWNWKAEDKELFLSMRAELKRNKVISDVSVIVDSMLGGDDNKAVRLAAARAGADAVLIVHGISSIDRYNNSYGITYILLVTPLFVPGTEADGLFMVNASMWDVRSNYLYMTAEAEGSAKQTRPAFLISESRITNVAKSSALTLLKNELTTRLLHMKAQ